MRAKPVRVTSDNGGILKVIGSGKSACINFHSGGNAFSVIENSPELRRFLFDASRRLRVPPDCIYCGDDKVQMASTGDPKHPFKTVPCEFCQVKK